MKRKLWKFLSVYAVAGMVVLASCGGGETKKEDDTKTMDLSKGKTVYEVKGTCATCHQPNGEGIEGTFPPLAKSDYLLADKKRAILQTIQGSNVPIVVNGKEYPGGVMGASVSAIKLTDEEVADVVNYILNSWGNNGGMVTAEEVKKTAGI